MTRLERYIGEVLDGKYRLERLLGQGGMGAVYLATHLGTERPVALKLIAPQFMRNDEFIERFKREARAAGRLRHPNVVDVTDFGFAAVGLERVAYLVMEYLDGCTLGEVLAEEKRLPLDWMLDILEQVCSAVDEAHHQGIVHRDLKPDNIWLEPNRLGGYRVKVLDFGIAKLAETGAGEFSAAQTALSTRGGPPRSDNASQSNSAARQHVPASSALDAVLQASLARVAAPPGSDSKHDPHAQAGGSRAELHELPAGTGLGAGGEEAATQLYAPADARAPQTPQASGDEETGTRLFVEEPGTRLLPSRPSSPEESRDAPTTAAAHAPRPTHAGAEAEATRLFAAPPAETAGDDAVVPTPTAAAAAALTRVGSIMGTPLYMSPEQCRGERLDARADIYSLGVIAYQMLAGETPFTGDMVTVMRQHVNDAPEALRARNRKVPTRVSRVVMSALAKDPAQRPQSAASFANSLTASAGGLGGLLRRAFALYSEHFPVFLRLSFIAHQPAILVATLLFLSDYFDATKRLPTALAIALTVLLGLLNMAANFIATSAIAGVTTIIVAQLQLAPLKPVRLRDGLAVLRRRWRPFLSTSVRITLRMMAGFLLFVVPFFIMMIKYAFYAPVVLLEDLEKKAALERSNELSRRSRWMVIGLYAINFALPLIIGGLAGVLSLKAGRSGAHITTKVSPRLVSLLNIITVPLISITTALLYLKLRQLGGETLRDVLEHFDDADAPRARWQQRMRSRLSNHTAQSRAQVDQPTKQPKLG